MSKLIKLDKGYRDWIYDVGLRFKRSQIKASIRVNDVMLRFYWDLGRDISGMLGQAKYGSGFYASVSEDLREGFPDVSSFSVSNLKYMRYFYELYPEAENHQRLADESSFENRQQVADEFPQQLVFSVPWGHHIVLLGCCKGNQDKALFYVRKIVENNWSRAILLNFLDSGLYERKGKAVTNFATTLPATQGDLAQEITKDPYSFDFLAIRERYDERELKNALMDSITKFLLELGAGFAFVGREYRIMAGGKEKFIDMLFYHFRLHCYVVLEVKVIDFDPAYMGQLGTYVVAVNHQLKTEDDAPTIGLLVCKSMDKVEAQYALEASSQPIGVSGYELSKLISEDFKGSLPTIEEIEQELGCN